MKHRSLFALPLVAMLMSGCEWFTDFKDQPKVEPWEAEWTMRDSAGKHVVSHLIPFRGNPQMSVPITGTSVAGYQISYSNSIATIDSFTPIPNPTPVSPASLENGRKYYQINCAVCHGSNGSARSQMLTKYMYPVPSLLTPVTMGRSDGYLFGMIRNGRGMMPTYDRIEEMDRWDVVNYVRALQGKAGAAPDTSRAGYPGQNGAAVPSYTVTSPTRPSPYNNPRSNWRIDLAPASVMGRPSTDTTTAPAAAPASPTPTAAPRRVP
ncbi:MAG: cytochrome c [Gemmatimonadota bacterium]|nr:cytochrome c [Gemmatimonadota bacterium]